MFINNKYTKWYNRIIDRSKNRLVSGYTEKHHIIPKSFGGSDLKSNIAILTAREHFICHLLLTKMSTGKNQRKAIHAAWGMCNLKGTGQERYKTSSRIYESLRVKHAEALSKLYTGVKNSKKANTGIKNGFYGKTHTEETKEKLRQARLGSKASAETKEKMKLSHQNRSPVSEETRKKISEATKGRPGLYGEKNGFYGKQHSVENREKKRREKLDAPKKICYHCSKEVDHMNYARWHGDNCRNK